MIDQRHIIRPPHPPTTDSARLAGQLIDVVNGYRSTHEECDRNTIDAALVQVLNAVMQSLEPSQRRAQ